VASAPAEPAHHASTASRGRSRFSKDEEQRVDCVWAGGRHGSIYELVPSDEGQCDVDFRKHTCARCGVGMRVITKNTFLYFPEDAEEEQQGMRRRAKSLC